MTRLPGFPDRGHRRDDLSPSVGTFLRGLSLGALVGAAIAGTLLLERRRHRHVVEPPPLADATPEQAGLQEPGAEPPLGD